MKHTLFCCLFTFAFMTATAINAQAPAQQPSADDVPLSSSVYFITPRAGAQHLNLSNDWMLGWRDSSTNSSTDFETVNDWVPVATPTSVPMALYRAGVMPQEIKARQCFSLKRKCSSENITATPNHPGNPLWESRRVHSRRIDRGRSGRGQWRGHRQRLAGRDIVPSRVRV